MQGTNENLDYNQVEYNEFLERTFSEVDGGFYDDRGFFITPNGSFWDDNKVYFNREGLDKHGGFYDMLGVYIPGPGWNEELECYQSEIMIPDDQIKEEFLENLREQLVEDYHHYERYFKYQDREGFADVDFEMGMKEDMDYFEEFVHPQFSGSPLEMNNCNGLNSYSHNMNNDNNLQYQNNENFNQLNAQILPQSANKLVSTVKITPNSGLKSNLDFSNPNVSEFN